MRGVRPTKAQGDDERLAQQKRAIEGPLVRLHVQITQQQYHQLKKLAFERDSRLAEVVRDVLGDWLGKHSS